MGWGFRYDGTVYSALVGRYKVWYCVVWYNSEWRGGVSPLRSLSRWGYVILFLDEMGYAL